MRTRLGVDEGASEIVDALAIARGGIERVSGGLHEFLLGVETADAAFNAHICGCEFDQRHLSTEGRLHPDPELTEEVRVDRADLDLGLFGAPRAVFSGSVAILARDRYHRLPKRG